jgi:hypothetical protein
MQVCRECQLRRANTYNKTDVIIWKSEVDGDFLGMRRG